MADALFGAPAEGEDPFSLSPLSPPEPNPNLISDNGTLADVRAPSQQLEHLKGPPVPKSFTASLTEGLSEGSSAKQVVETGDQQQQVVPTPTATFPPPPISAPFPPPSPSQARLPEGAVKTLAVTPTRDGDSKKEEVDEVVEGVAEPPITEVVAKPPITEVVAEPQMIEKEGQIDEVVAGNEVEKEDEVRGT